MKRHLLMLAVASCFAAAQAGAMTADEHKVAKEKIEADYKVDKAACDAMKGNAKDVCQKEAEGKQKVAKAELQQMYKPSDANARKVQEEKIEAAYAVYMDRQAADIADVRREEDRTIPADFSFNDLPGLSNELRLKLSRDRPANVAQAARIDGMTPAAISLLLTALRRSGSSGEPRSQAV